MKRFVQGLMMVLAIVALFSGCSLRKPGGTVSVVSPDFFGFGDDLAHQLVVNRHFGQVSSGERLILTTLVNLDDLYETSGFGRALTESLSTSLFKEGFRVAEIRKASGLYIKSKSGELSLTRDARLMAEQEQAQAIVAGTYSLTPSTVIVNVRLLDAASQEVLSVASLELQRSRNVNYMLMAKSGAGVGQLSGYER